MFTPHITIIDDEIEQLNDIQRAFFNAGYPCLPIHYDVNDLDNVSGIDHINIKFNPRIIVTDLNLRNGSLSRTDKMPLVFPIYKLLDKINTKGPYVLIFWSRISDEVESVMQLLQTRFYDKINLPIFYTCINKSEYLGEGNHTKLKNKIEEIIKENDLANALLDWELRIAKAASETINSLFSLTKPKKEEIENNNYHDIHSGHIKKVLASIGNEAVGITNAKKHPETAVDIGLHPVLNDHLSNPNILSPSALWGSAVPEIGGNVPLDSALKTKLNTFYHIEQVDKNYPKSCRGSFLPISKELLDDPLKKSKLERRLGQSLIDIIEEEFLYCINSITTKQLLRDKTILGFIETSTECDQAQNKSKLHRYLLAALTPIKSGKEEINLKKI